VNFCLQKKILFKIQIANVLENEFQNKKEKSTFLPLPPALGLLGPSQPSRPPPLPPSLSLSR
jgi:hypothetical protein